MSVDISFLDGDEGIASNDEVEDTDDEHCVKITRVREGNIVRRTGSHSSCYDEGELCSDDESISEDQSSEEGEIQSEVDELDVPPESPDKEETPWERGLRLARERLQRTKTLKETESDLAQKRMTLSVPTSVLDETISGPTEPDTFWPYYFQASIIGRTELTARRFLPEDLLPASNTETTAWRQSLKKTRRDGRQRTQRSRQLSRSVSSSASSSSHDSSHSVSSDSGSTVSSLVSVAASWKATCAKAMKAYLASPLGNADRRRRRTSRSSASNSGSSRSRSDSNRSDSAHRFHRAGYKHPMTSGAKLAGRSVARYWKDEQRGQRDSDRSSPSRSRSRSRTKASRDWGSGDRIAYRGNRRTIKLSKRDTSISNHSSSPVPPSRYRSDAPPLPHERPVKRPWVAAPTPIPSNEAASKKNSRVRHRSSSGSRSGSAALDKDADEKRFITSWSRSPSSGAEGRPNRGVFRRERLPDVIPGGHSGQPRRAVTPSRRRKGRSPFADDTARGAVNNNTAVSESISDRLSGRTGTVVKQPELSELHGSQEHRIASGPPPHQAATGQPESERHLMHNDPGTDAGPAVQPPTAPMGELPSASNRPGVRMTLAPRLKTSSVAMSSLASATARAPPTNRSAHSPPASRQTRPLLPPLQPNNDQRLPTKQLAQPTLETPAMTTPAHEQIRQQAEAAAAAVEARERRRAAEEATRRPRPGRRRKREDLSSIPLRSRPTYRRQSFSDSSSGSSSSGSSHSTSRSRSGSRSPSDSELRKQQLRSTEDETYKTHAQGSVVAKQNRGMVGISSPPNTQYGVRGDARVVEDVYSSRRLAPYGNMRQSLNMDDPVFLDKRYVKQSRQRSNFDNESYWKQQGNFDSSAKNQFAQTKRAQIDTAPYDYTGFAGRQRDGPMDDSKQMRYGGAMKDNPRYPSMRRPVDADLIYAKASKLDRPLRPRTPHGDDAIGSFDRRHRSPHADSGFIDQSSKVDRSYAGQREQFQDPEYGVPTRKRARILVDSDVQPTSPPNPEMRRARSRHRSRGPGIPIDRSEPFESESVGGSLAAEQRLRELRERLNLVDDAIAEIKAGSSALDVA